MWEYLTEPTGFEFQQSPTLGLIVLWIVVLVASVLWMRATAPKNAARLAFRRRTSLAMIIFAVVGLAQIILRTLDVPIIQWRLWTLLIFVAFAIYAAYAFWDSRSRLTDRAASSGRAVRVAPKHITAPGSAPKPPEKIEKAEPITARRDARRSKKRKR